VAALARARDEGLCRFLGVTGHGLRIASMHLRSLDEFDFDSVLLPYSYVLARESAYRADTDALFERCAARDVAVQTIKSVARRRWAPDHEGPRHSWYEPLDDPGAIARSVRWVLSHDRLFVNSSSDAKKQRSTLEAAATPAPVPADEELEADLATYAVRPLFDGGSLERI
jgi:hypothetical protein